MLLLLPYDSTTMMITIAITKKYDNSINNANSNNIKCNC